MFHVFSFEMIKSITIFIILSCSSTNFLLPFIIVGRHFFFINKSVPIICFSEKLLKCRVYCFKQIVRLRIRKIKVLASSSNNWRNNRIVNMIYCREKMMLNLVVNPSKKMMKEIKVFKVTKVMTISYLSFSKILNFFVISHTFPCVMIW